MRTTLLAEPSSQVREREYDAVGRLAVERDAEGHERVYQYDAVGNRVREIDRRLSVVEHEYDARDRRVATTVHLDRVTTPAREVVTHFD